MYGRQKKILGRSQLKREHTSGSKKKPSDFLLRDTHADVLSDVEFKQLWWNIQETMNTSTTPSKSTSSNSSLQNNNIRMVMSILLNCASYRVLHIKQLISVLKLFDSVGDKLEIVEMFVLRCHKLVYKTDIIPLFSPILRPYVADILLTTMLVEPTDGIPQNALLFRNKLSKNRDIVKGVVAALERVHYNRENQNEVVVAMLLKDSKPMSHRQAYKILKLFVDDCDTMLIVIQLLNKFVVGFTCREIALLLSDIPSVSQRVQVLQSMSTMVLDSEHRWITLDVGFSSCTSIIKEQVASSLQTWSILPRSFIFGTVIGKCVCFVLDTSSSMECTFVTCQGERISRLRFVVRELSKILRHQMNPSTRFNIVAFDKIPIAWSDGGPMEASVLNVLSACKWLRQLKAEGPTNTALAIDLAFRSTGIRMDEMFIVIDGDPSNGIDRDMKLLISKTKPYLNKFTVKPIVHVSAIVLGFHETDDIQKTEIYAYDLAKWGGGLCRFLVDDSYQNVSSTDTTKYVSHERVLINYNYGLSYQLLNVFAYVGLIGTIYVTQTYPEYTGRKTYLDIIHLIPTFFNPDPSIYRFWTIILAMYGIVTLHLFRRPLFKCLQRNNTDQDDILLGQLQLMTWKLPVLFACTALWLLCLQSEMLLLSLILSYINLILLCLLHVSLEIGTHPMKYNRPKSNKYQKNAEKKSNMEEKNETKQNDGDEGDGEGEDEDGDGVGDVNTHLSSNGILWSERLFMEIPISASLAWYSFLVCLQTSQYFQSWEWFGWGWQEEWAMLIIIVVGVLGIIMATVFDDAVFAMVSALGLAGICQNNFREARAAGDIQEISRIQDFSYGFMLYIASSTMAILVVVVSFRPIAKGYSELLYKSLFEKRYQNILDVHIRESIAKNTLKAHTLTWKQLFALIVWMILIFINLLSERWFNDIIGLEGKTPLINHMTWSSVLRLSDLPYGDVSQYNSVLRVMPANFFFYIFYFVYFMLFTYVCVQLLPLEQLGTKVNYLKEEDLALEKKVFVRGTRRQWSIKKYCCGLYSLPLFHKWRLTPKASHLLIDVSHNYFVATCLFNVLFLVCFLHREYLTSLIFLLLLFVTLILWYIKINAWYVITPLKSDDEIMLLKKEFDQAHNDEEEEIRTEKWDTIEQQLRKKPLDISFVEIVILHVPISAYLGLVSYVVILISGYFTLIFVGLGPGGSEGGWNMSDWYDEGWAWAMIALVSLIIIGISGKTQDPILPLFFSTGPAAVYWQNTQGTCTWDTTSGIASRQPDAKNPNQKIKSLTPENEIVELYQRGGQSGGRLHWFWNLTDDNGAFVNSDWKYTSTTQESENTKDANEIAKLQPQYWCKKAVEASNNNYYQKDETNPGKWAYRYQEPEALHTVLTYYDETTNQNGDYVYINGRCRRIYKDSNDLPITAADQCDSLALQRSGNPDVVRGFYWMSDLCVEDSGTCPYIFGKSPMTSHTPEYVLATASLWITVLLWIVSFGVFFLRHTAYKARKMKTEKRGKIFQMDAF